VTKFLTRDEWESAVAEQWGNAIEFGLRETVAKWMVKRGYATGHGDTVEDLLKELEWQIAERERKQCANLIDQMVSEHIDGRSYITLESMAGVIRARK
jgi:hypothetical protein